MSDMERNKGKLIPSSMEEVLESFPDASIGDLPWDTDGKYTVISGVVYEVEWEVDGEVDFQEFVDVSKNEDGSFNFHTYHYNGGAHWTELLEDKLK